MNTKELSDASARRQDDLREETNKRYDDRVRTMEQMAILRADHAREIRQLESDRLDKIRQVDVLAGNTAADRALVAIQTLATVTAGNAETLRAMVASTATTIATQLDQRLGAVTERIAALEKSSYTGAGRSAVSDPAMIELLTEVKNLRASSADLGGRRQGVISAQTMISWVVALVVAFVTIGSVVVGIAFAVLKP